MSERERESVQTGRVINLFGKGEFLCLLVLPYAKVINALLFDSQAHIYIITFKHLRP